MSTAQAPFLVSAILILVSMIFGGLLGRTGKPYGKAKLVIHLFFALWFIVGFAFILYGQVTMGGTKGTWIPIALMGLMTLIQLVTGMQMMASRKLGKALPKVHTIATILMLLADIYAFIITGHPF